MTDSLDDPFIQDLMDRFSHLGYAVWFGLIEVIAKENKNSITGNLSISPTYLRRKLRTSPTKLREVFDFCQTNGKLLVNFSKEKWEFNFPKIAEIKDNYTKDLQASRKKLSIEVEVEEEKEVEEDKKKKRIKDLPSRAILTDEEFIQALKINPAYQGVDIDNELARMDAWFLTPKGRGRKKTHKFILNWLDRAERILKPQGASNGTHTNLAGKDYTKGLEDF